MEIAKTTRILSIVLSVVLVLVGTVSATERSWTAAWEPPIKTADHVVPGTPGDLREGGEDMATAVPIPALPFTDTGNTCGHIDDFAEMCPYGNWAPDLWYSLEMVDDALLTVDLCGSLYDTAVFVIDANYDLLACNDDFYFDDVCGYYVSKIERAFIAGGQTIYILMDGYTNDCGEYFVEIFTEPDVPCVVECPSGSELEGEPPLADGYVDAYNGGCNSPQFGSPFQDLFGTGGHTLSFCGKGGWYDSQGNDYRDTDWFTVVLASDGPGFLEVEIEAAEGSYLFELAPQDCDAVEVAQQVQVGPCSPATMTITGAPGDLVWIWVGADQFTPPPGFEGHEYDYVLSITGLEDGVIATEAATWSGVKSAYR